MTKAQERAFFKLMAETNNWMVREFKCMEDDWEGCEKNATAMLKSPAEVTEVFRLLHIMAFQTERVGNTALQLKCREVAEAIVRTHFGLTNPEYRV